MQRVLSLIALFTVLLAFTSSSDACGCKRWCHCSKGSAAGSPAGSPAATTTESTVQTQVLTFTPVAFAMPVATVAQQPQSGVGDAFLEKILILMLDRLPKTGGGGGSAECKFDDSALRAEIKKLQEGQQELREAVLNNTTGLRKLGENVVKMDAKIDTLNARFRVDPVTQEPGNILKLLEEIKAGQ